MNRSIIILGFCTVFNWSCQKKFLCPDCEKNKPPIAIAGTDQTLTLPKDSVMLDGTASTDIDGTITSYKWITISGPVSAPIASVASSKTLVKFLGAGVYQFELTVTDNGGLSAKDTVQILVDNPVGNQPPVACAGADQTITLPTNAVTLDGSCSADPDNNITTYLWTKISGPTSFNITNANAVQTQVTTLVQGLYQFVLTVVDNDGLSSNDTVKITLTATSPTSDCDNRNRARMNAQLISIGSLSISRVGYNIAAAGSKILFAGGAQGSLSCPDCWGTTLVDIYDTITRTWSTSKLSEGRWGIAAVKAGNNIFFAGGESGDGANDTYYSNVDIYDAATNTWATQNLSEPRSDIATAVVGNKIFFAGGEKNWYYDCSDKVDIYDLSTKSWSTTILSNPRAFIATASINNKIYFAGGNSQNRSYTPSTIIDIYDNTTNSWSTSSLQSVSGIIAGTSLSDKIYWSIGCKLEIHNVITGTTSFTNLSRPEDKWWQVYGRNVLIKGNKLIFLHDNNVEFDIYDTNSNSWSIGVLPHPINLPAAVSANNTIYVTDGTQVWKLEF